MAVWLALSLVVSVQPYWGVGDGQLAWSIAGDRSGVAGPNILSELQFQQLDARHYGLRGELQLHPVAGSPGFSFVLRGNAASESWRGGDLEDADYSGNNRSGLYSLSVAEVAGDDGRLLRGGLGLRYDTPSRRHGVRVLFGGSVEERTLNFRNGQQLVADPSRFSASLEELTANLANYLDSDYLTEWTGSWLAAAYWFKWDAIQLTLGGRLLHGQYYGEGRWNLRATGPDALRQPKSFSHEADADGWEASVTLGYALTQRWGLSLDWRTQRWESDRGQVTTFFADGGVRRTVFNGADWDSERVSLGVDFRF